jgi:hypothetical protein
VSQAGAEEIIAKAEAVFGPVERPEHFTDHTHCCECSDHDEELQPYTPANMPRSALGHMGWDPITFCTDKGFRYFLPGMIRIVLTEAGDDNYYEQFMWHVTDVAGGHDRYAACTREERAVVALALAWLLENTCEEVEQEMVAGELLAALERWSED